MLLESRSNAAQLYHSLLGPTRAYQVMVSGCMFGSNVIDEEAKRKPSLLYLWNLSHLFHLKCEFKETHASSIFII